MTQSQIRARFRVREAELSRQRDDKMHELFQIRHKRQKEAEDDYSAASKVVFMDYEKKLKELDEEMEAELKRDAD